MDAKSLANADVDRLNEKDKAELRQFLSNEVQISQIQGRKQFPPPRSHHAQISDDDGGAETHALTETCWKKCVTGAVKSSKLEKAEEGCMTNCVQRFLDVNFLTVKHLQGLRQ